MDDPKRRVGVFVGLFGWVALAAACGTPGEVVERYRLSSLGEMERWEEAVNRIAVPDSGLSLDVEEFEFVIGSEVWGRLTPDTDGTAEVKAITDMVEPMIVGKVESALANVDGVALPADTATYSLRGMARINGLQFEENETSGGGGHGKLFGSGGVTLGTLKILTDATIQVLDREGTLVASGSASLERTVPLSEKISAKVDIDPKDIDPAIGAVEGVTGESAPRMGLWFEDGSNRDLSRGELAEALENAAIAAALDAVNQLSKQVGGS